MKAGCCTLVNAIIMHVVSNISDPNIEVGVIPKFHMEPKRFEYAATSYGGVVDFLIVKGPPDNISQFTDIAILFVC